MSVLPKTLMWHSLLKGAPWPSLYLSVCGAGVPAARAGELSARNVANIVWALAKLSGHPGDALLGACAAQAAARVHEANAQNIANTLWALASLGAAQAPWGNCCSMSTGHLKSNLCVLAVWALLPGRLAQVPVLRRLHAWGLTPTRSP